MLNEIPKRFQLAGLTIDVVEDNTMIASKQVIGEARYSCQQILMDVKGANPELTMQSFYHELTHWIFYILGEAELRDNEKLVDTFSHLLYQYEKTKEY